MSGTPIEAPYRVERIMRVYAGFAEAEAADRADSLALTPQERMRQLEYMRQQVDGYGLVRPIPRLPLVLEVVEREWR